MASLKFSEWHNSVKAGVAVLGTFGAIIGIYVAVEAWAEDKISASERRQLEHHIEQQVRNEIDHDKIVQSSRLESSSVNIRVTTIQMEQLEDEIDERSEDGKEPTARQERQLERYNRLLETYEMEQSDATEKLTRITTTTTTTTTTEESQ